MKSRPLFPVMLIAAALNFSPLISLAHKGQKDERNNKPKKDKPKKDTRPGKSNQAPGHNKNAPFDLGLSLLIGAGAAYGIKKAIDNRKKGSMSVE